MEHLYFNDYDPTKTAASDYECSGQTIIEVWTTLIEFNRQAARNTYLDKPTHAEHVLVVGLDIIDGVNKFVFYIDDQPSAIDPVDTLPTDEELDALLGAYG